MEKEKKIKISFNILAIICILLFCFAITPKTLQNDTFYTIKIGEHILQNGVDKIDPFSWHENLPYTYPHWAYDVGIYLVYTYLGGMAGIYISTIILCMILGLTIYLTNLKLSKNQLTSFVITIGMLYLLRGYVAARAQLVTFILFTLTILFIEKFLETKKIRYAIGLIIIPILIANVHCAVWPFYFVLYLPYVVEYLICVIRDAHLNYKIPMKNLRRKIKKLSKKVGNEEKIRTLELKLEEVKTKFNISLEKSKKMQLNPYKIKIEKNSATKWLILIMLISILTGLLTPIGDAPYTYLVKTMQGNTTKNIAEHLPLVLAQNKDAVIVVVLFIAILMFTDTKIKLHDLFMLVGLIILMFMTRRQLSMLVLICGYIFNKLVCSLFDKYDPSGCENMVNNMTHILGKILTVLVVIVISVYFYQDKIKAVYIDESAYPIEAAKYIKENLDLENIKLFNEYNYGSYLLFQDIPVFIDSRADLYTPEFSGWDKDIFTDFLNISSLSAYYETKFEEYGITHVITYTNSKLTAQLSRDSKYKELYHDDKFVIYEREINNETV